MAMMSNQLLLNYILKIMYILLETFGGPEYAIVVTDENGENVVFSSYDDAFDSDEYKDLQHPIIVNTGSGPKKKWECKITEEQFEEAKKNISNDPVAKHAADDGPTYPEDEDNQPLMQ